MGPRTKTRDGVAILRDRCIGDDPERLAQLRDEKVSADVAQLIYDARTSAGLSQKELARLIDTTQSVISRLEDSDYGGRSLTMLDRIARALGKKLTVAMTDRARAGKREAFVGFDSGMGRPGTRLHFLGDLCGRPVRSVRPAGNGPFRRCCSNRRGTSC